ncbi:MAG: hypothetical protein IPF42_18940, partial [Candidatus Microthrix sp.]|nr:hypothetical protein [Candidatus Microthrix sp.]
MTNADTAKVDAALDALLAEHDPTTEGYEEFRGHQFDAGLAWVQYPEGNGGLGVAPQLQQNVNRRPRTDPQARKHRGMTYFALDMKAPGVDVRPLRQITGEAEFNEVYMTDVRVPDADRIGAEGEGWRAALTTLMNERTAIGGSGGGGNAPKPGSGPIAELVSAYTANADTLAPGVRDDVMALYVRSEVLRLTNWRAAQAAKSGNPGPEGSVGKAVGAILNQDISEAVLDVMGPAGQIDYDFTFRRPTIAALTGGTAG